jgi:hypothetical protein
LDRAGLIEDARGSLSLAKLVILISPARSGRFDARLAGTEQFLIEGSRTPFCDSVCALLTAGLAARSDLLVMRHRGSPHDALKAAVQS